MTLNRSDPRESGVRQHHDSTAQRNGVGMHVCVYLMPIAAWPVLQVIPVNEMHILTHKHGFKHLTGFAAVAHEMCLLNA